MADKWNDKYKNLSRAHKDFRYGNTESYDLGYAFLKDCGKIEDWGCGTGGFKSRFGPTDLYKYVGVDGSKTPFADVKKDLKTYVSSVDGIYMRHVLEHNYDWKAILENACKSFTKKMCLVLFTPFGAETKEIAHNLQYGVDVPDLSLSKEELIAVFEKYSIKHELVSLNTATQYNAENVFYLSK